MPWKLWNTRLTKTMADINGLNSTKGALVQQYIDGLTVPDRKLLSNAMEQGAYTANPQGDAMEKGERAYRRALLLVLTAHAKTGVPANDLALGIAAYRNHPGEQGKALLMAELSKLDESIRQMQQSPRVAACAKDGAAWLAWDGTRRNPLLAGSAIGQRGTNGPGTLGCFVRLEGRIYILSNMHVLQKKGVTDTAILHPPHLLGGTYNDVIARVKYVAPELDAALALVEPGVICQNETPEGDSIVGFNASPEPDRVWTKRGVATLKRWVEYSGPNRKIIRRNDLGPVEVEMEGQIEIKQADIDESRCLVQVPGDSGAVVTNEKGEVVALMHGQDSRDATIGQATGIGAILARWPMQILEPGSHVAPPSPVSKSEIPRPKGPRPYPFPAGGQR